MDNYLLRQDATSRDTRSQANGSEGSKAIKISSDPVQRSRAGCSALPSAPDVLEAQAGGIAPIALGPVTTAVVAEVPERPEVSGDD